MWKLYNSTFFSPLFSEKVSNTASDTSSSGGGGGGGDGGGGSSSSTSSTSTNLITAMLVLAFTSNKTTWTLHLCIIC